MLGLDGDPKAALKARVFLREWFSGEISLEPLPDGGLMAHWNENRQALLSGCERLVAGQDLPCSKRPPRLGAYASSKAGFGPYRGWPRVSSMSRRIFSRWVLTSVAICGQRLVWSAVVVRKSSSGMAASGSNP